MRSTQFDTHNIPNKAITSIDPNYHKEITSLNNTSIKRKHDDYMSDVSSSYEANSDDDYSHESPNENTTTNEEHDVDEEDPKLKKKAQNRAAQKAFRDRKERYLKELENKIKRVQSSHVEATTRLFRENQKLRSIVYHLELEISILKDEPINKPDIVPDLDLNEKKSGQSWLSCLGPPESLEKLNTFPSDPSRPLQIRSATPTVNKTKRKSSCIKPKSPENNIKSSHQSLDSPKPYQNKKQKAKEPKCPDIELAKSTESTDQSITFSITTPKSLRSASDDELLKKSEVIESVKLYPDHSHPANILLEKTKPKRPDPTLAKENIVLQENSIPDSSPRIARSNESTEVDTAKKGELFSKNNTENELRDDIFMTDLFSGDLQNVLNTIFDSRDDNIYLI